MTSGPRVREATPTDLPAIKRILDMHRHELGFVRMPALAEALARGWLQVAELDGEVRGVVNWWARRDGVVVLYNIAVAPEARRQGLGGELLGTLVDWSRVRQARAITLKCPSDLPSNDFYASSGFQLERQETGKRRPLNCWTLDLS